MLFFKPNHCDLHAAISFHPHLIWRLRSLRLPRHARSHNVFTQKRDSIRLSAVPSLLQQCVCLVFLFVFMLGVSIHFGAYVCVCVTVCFVFGDPSNVVNTKINGKPLFA